MEKVAQQAHENITKKEDRREKEHNFKLEE
jgi:hypothetical protein